MPYTDPLTRHSLVPLILRLTLAVIFTYHGLGKIVGHGNDWGATWANHTFQKELTPPKQATELLEKELARLRYEEVTLTIGDEAYDENLGRQEELAMAVGRVQ